MISVDELWQCEFILFLPNWPNWPLDNLLCSIGAGSTTLMHFLWGLSNSFLYDGLELSDMIMKRRSSWQTRGNPWSKHDFFSMCICCVYVTQTMHASHKKVLWLTSILLASISSFGTVDKKWDIENQSEIPISNHSSCGQNLGFGFGKV